MARLTAAASDQRESRILPSIRPSEALTPPARGVQRVPGSVGSFQRGHKEERLPKGLPLPGKENGARLLPLLFTTRPNGELLPDIYRKIRAHTGGI